MLPTFPLKPPFSKGFPWNFPHEITIDPRGEGTRHPTLRGAAAPKKVTVTVTENPPNGAGWRRGSFTHHFMGNSWGNHGEFIGIS